jgi:hypothetical protein
MTQTNPEEEVKMSDETRVEVSLDDATKRLEVIPDYDPGDGAGPCVHTFLSGGLGLLGAHWKLDKIRALIEEHGVEESGEQAKAMRHGLVILRDGEPPLFLATKQVPA